MSKTDSKGTSVFDLVETAIALGLDAKGVKATFESLHLTTLPAIVHIIDGRISHYLVLTEISAKKVWVMDPAEGKIKKLTAEAFQHVWTGVAVLLLPGEKFIPNKKPRVLCRLIQLILPFKNALILASVCAAMVSLLGIVLSVYVKEILDKILIEKEKLLLNFISAIAIVLMLIQFITGIVKNKLVLKSGRAINSTLILSYYRHVLKLPHTFFDSMRVGEMLSRVNDAVKITSFIYEVAVHLVVDLLIVVISLSMMFYYNWKIACFVLLIIPVYGALYFLSNRINRLWQRNIATSGAELDSLLVESLGAAKTIKHLALENYFSARVAGKLDCLLDNIYGSSVRQMYIQSVADMTTKVFTIILLWIGSYYVIEQHLTAGELISFYTLLIWMTVPVLYLLGANKTMTEALIAAERLFEIMDLHPSENGWKKIYAVENLSIEFKNVRFGYGNNEPVLRNISLAVPRGKITGIIGKSGSGKSTLASLLLRAYEPETGSITVNDVNIKELDHENITALTSLVTQKAGLFSVSIAENITLGRQYDEKRLADICERLDITGFVSLFAEGINTLVSEQGNNLSGGQIQRIAIARALYRSTPVLILDEATASIDAVSEEKIMQTIEWYKNCGNTVIIIAHSESTLKICDNIVVLEDGVIK